MTQQENEFIARSLGAVPDSGHVTWSAPSNIALVKYWGKIKEQLPANPSISFTLNSCRTITRLSYTKKTEQTSFTFDLLFDGQPKEDFKPKIQKFLERIEVYCPYLKQYHLTIDTQNTFPHSSGIASSASGMAALALCFVSLEKVINPKLTEEQFYQKASFLARLGSGSACRSISGELVVWGQHPDIGDSSDLYGISFPGKIHPVFQDFQDTILLVDKGEKQVSSTVGHDLMHNHPFAERRFKQAVQNLSDLKAMFENGDLEAFMEIVESEALTLHAMMMTSRPYFILMKPNTLQIINKIWNFRKTTKTPVCFTLDAGANVHVLYPESAREEVLQFIKNELVGYCQNGQYICDAVGNGSQKISS